MSNSEIIDVTLVKRLIASQFPQWQDLPITPVAYGGWDNRTFHLGDTMTVRLPSHPAYALQVEKEQRWLPWLAPVLPLPIPVPLAMGVPSDDFALPWSVYRWLDGETAMHVAIADLTRFAMAVGEFLVALQAADATDGPSPGPHNFYRGGPLDVYEEEARRAIQTLGEEIDGPTATAVIDLALNSRWSHDPVWFHGDIAVGNLLTRDGELSAVIDFGTSGVGDPACDLAIAWTLFAGESREAFRSILPLDDAAWTRGRGWTLWKALIVAAGSSGTNPQEAERSRRVIDEVLADHRRFA